jgi:pimeloyl-ACP methyl ester carboxylesterase
VRTCGVTLLLYHKRSDQLLFDLKPFSIEEPRTAITEKTVRFGSNGIVLNGTLYLPARATDRNHVPGVVLCHGYGGKQADFEAIARQLAAENIATLTFDFRGHGGSEGILDGSLVDDVMDAWEYLSNQAEVDRKHMGLIGHSMGAFSAILAAGKLKKAIMLVVLACPGEVSNSIASNPGHFAYPVLMHSAKWIFKINNLIYKLKVRVDWRKFLAFWPKGKTSEALAGLENCSKLFVFCLSDLASPYQRFLPAYAMASEPKQVIVTPGRHNAPMENESLRTQWMKWVVNALQSRQKS